MISIILWALAALCSAAMDTVDHHWSTSIFSLIKNPKWRLFFNENKGWLNKYNFRDIKYGRKTLHLYWPTITITDGGKWWAISFSMDRFFDTGINIHPAFLDSWHSFKSLQIILMTVALVLFPLSTPICIFSELGKNIFATILIYGLVWNGTFSISYNYLLNK